MTRHRRPRLPRATHPHPHKPDPSWLVARVEDSLRRPVHGLDLQAVRKLVEGRSVLVTGAAGTIGSNLAQHLHGLNPARLLLLDNSESGLFELVEHRLAATGRRAGPEPIVADVRDEKRVDRIFEEERPDVVVHGAAIKHVHLVERQPLEAVKTNVFGTLNVASAARAHGCSVFLYLSTDKAVHPSGFMGASKRVGEMVVRSTLSRTRVRHCIIRFCNVAGSRGSVVPLFAEQIARGGPVQVTHREMERYFVTKEEAVALILHAGAVCRAGEVYVIDADGPVRIVALAEQMLRLAGTSPRITPLEYIGPRPGEKLKEEAIHRAPDLAPTHCPRLLRAPPEPVERSLVGRGLVDLKRAADEHWGSEKLAELLRRMVPATVGGK